MSANPTSIIRRTEVVILTICVVMTAMLYATNIAGAEGTMIGSAITTTGTVGGALSTTDTNVQGAVQTTVTQVLPAVEITATPDLCDSGSINLAWNAVANADGYRLFRDSTGNAIYEGTRRSHVDSGLANGSNHMYYIQAFRSGFTSSNDSLMAMAPIACPTVIEPYGGDAPTGTSITGTGTTGTALPVAKNLTAMLDTAVEKGVVLTWSSDPGAGSFGVFRRILGTDFVVIGTVLAPTHRFVDKQLMPGTQYEYQVRVCSSAGCSTPSNVVGVSTPAVTVQPVITTAATPTPAKAPAAQTNVTDPVPVSPLVTTVVKSAPTTVVQPAPVQIRPTTFSPTTITTIPSQTSPIRNTTNLRFQSETQAAVPSNSAPPSQIVASMQAIAETVSISRSAVNTERDNLIAAIDAHIETVRRITPADQFAEQENTVRAIREALVSDIDNTLGRGAGITPKDEARLQAAIRDGFAVIGRAAAIDPRVPDTSRQLVTDSIGSLARVSQDAIASLQAAGAGDLYKDTNSDGISDFDSVHIYNLDPIKPSPVTVVDGRTLTAGDKVLLGYDPTANVLMAVPREEPELSLAPETTVYTVADVQLNPQKLVTFSGTALPNSYVTLYIYSTPIVVTVKTDSSGKWKYTVDRELESGEHKIYAASVDNTGRIVAKTVAIPFTKTAEAATLDTVPSLGAARVEKPSLTNNRAALPLIAISILFIIGALYVMGKDRTPKNPTPTAA
ncbi:MAG: hypothetical protein KBD06_00850 [Candidatus Pacebacteria bacterium]|nr:hypothetical protein [Candidatus Paceibacterota bacterium]